MDTDYERETGAEQISPFAVLQEKLRSDPGLMDRLQGILSGMVANESKPEEEPAPDAEDAPPSSDALSSMLSNPEILAKLPQMMDLLRGMQMPKPSPSGKAPPPKTQTDYRNDLLLALRPFLSKERRDAIDTILQVTRLGELVRKMR